jgi:hypothetical protein
MTVGGQSCAEVGGFVQLLDQKVLDPRLLSKLLRFQAAMLIRLGFTRQLTAFRFESSHRSSVLADSLPLNISLLGLLVEGSLYGKRDPQSVDHEHTIYHRRAIRGQNLDRAGLSARHMKILNLLSSPRGVGDLADQLQWDADEVIRVLDGFVLAELVEQRERVHSESFVAFEPDPNHATQLRNSLATAPCSYEGKVVRDRLALQLVLKRSIPECLFFAADSPESCKVIHELRSSGHPALGSIRWIAIGSDRNSDGSPVDWPGRLGFAPDEIMPRPCTGELIHRVMDRILASDSHPPRTTVSQLDIATSSLQPAAIAAGVES